MAEKLDSNGSTPSVLTEKPVTAFSKEAFLSPDFNPKHINLIVQEGILLGGGAATILLQLAEPGVAQGVNQHSNFAYRVTDRLRTTMTYVYCMSYGTPAEKKAVTDMVNKIHDSVTGTLDEGRDKGKPFHANDPELQLWVAATLYAMGVEVYKRIFGDIKDEYLHEKIYQEYSILACSLMVPPEMWPSTRKDFWEYWDRKVAGFEITAHAKAVADDLLYLRKAPLYLRIWMPSVRVVTADLLPPRLRREFGVNEHPYMYKFLQTLVRGTYRPLPLKIRSYPVRFYMKDMRKKLAQHQKIFAKA
jgi:uncharacterized protein (DUF2236 family)